MSKIVAYVNLDLLVFEISFPVVGRDFGVTVTEEEFGCTTAVLCVA